MNSLNRVMKIMVILSILTFSLLSTALINPGDACRKYVYTAKGEWPKAEIAVYNVCAWPNLTVLNDGTIVTTIHNQPSLSG